MPLTMPEVSYADVVGRRQLVRVTEPLAMDPVRPAVVGTVAFALALVVLLVLGDRLGPDDTWWVWTAGLGVAGGLVGCLVAVRVRRRRTGGPARPPQEVGTSPASTTSSGPAPSTTSTG